MAVLRYALCALCLALVGLNGTSAPAQELAAPEYKVKAVFLYNFAKLTKWPTNSFPAADSPLIIGVLGKDPFGSYLDDAVKDKRIEGHRILVQRFKHIEDVKGCHILFVGTSEKDRLASILTVLARQPILSVSDLDGFAERGGVIRLMNEGDHIRFAINTTAAERAGLTLSSKLLRLATIVRMQEEGG